MATGQPLKFLTRLKKSRKFRDTLRKNSRKLHLEHLEDRRVMAGAILSAVFADGSVVPINSVLGEAPREMQLRFSDQDGLDAASLSTGIRILRSGFDDSFGEANDVVIQPGLLQLADNPREVIIRFADNLPDDLYRIQLIGAGLTPLLNLNGERFNNGVNQNFNFELDLGPKVISVVPQPITRNPTTGALTQAKNQVVVYFNNDQLDPISAQNPAFYQLTDTITGRLLLPQTAQYSAADNRVVLTFASDLGDSSFHLKIGVSEEQNGTLGTAVNVGTIVQRAEFKTFDSPVLLDPQGNPLTIPIPDLGTVISRITVGDAFLVRDVNVELNINHEWGPDLRVFLIGPQGDRVELVRDLGVDLRQGQIYGTKFNDLDGDGVQDVGEAGLAGWTIFLDDNRNAVLDAGERSTVSAANGDYAFIGLELGRELGRTYFLAEVGQPLWRQTTPTAGAERDLFQADFSNGSQQTLRVIPDPVNGNPTLGTFILGFGGRATAPITYAGANATTAANIQQALQAIVGPGNSVAAQFVGTNPVRFQLTFTRNGLGTPVDHAPIVVQASALNFGSLAVDTVGSTDGFTSTGPANQWHLSVGRGGDTGHTGQQSFYFGANEIPTGGGTYQDNANGTLISPTVDLTDQRLTGPLSLEFNHRLNTEASFDFARVEVVTASGQRTTLLNTDTDTSGFESVALDISQFAGQQIHFEFTFVSDGSVIFEGWYVDDIRVTEQRGEHSVTLSTLPQATSAKDVDFGATLGSVFGPDQFGYTAFAVTPDFEDITATGQRTLQEFLSTGFAKQAGGTGSDQGNSLARDASGNIYVTGSFQGTAFFGPGLTLPSLTSLGVGDVFLAKYDSSGNLLWVQGMGGTGNDSGNDVQVDSAGNVLITGSFNATVDFDPSAGVSNLTSAGSSDAFVAKFDSSGNLIWAGQLGGTGVDVGEGLATAGTEVVVTGSFSGTADMNPGGGVSNLISAGGTDIFVTRLTSGGNFIWTKGYGSTGSDTGRAAAVDLLGNISVTGSFSGTVDFNPAPDPAGPALVSAGSTDGFVLQLTGGGGFRWNQRFGGTQADFGAGVAVDSANAVIVAGGLTNNARGAKYTGLTGVQQWEQVLGGGSTDLAEDVAVDALDRIYLTGGFRTSFSLGGTTFTSAGGQDVFVARFTPAGGFDLARGMGGTQDDIGSGIAVDGNGDAYYVGSFRVTATFDTGPGSASLTSAGSTDAFLAKLAIVRGQDDATVHLTDADLGNFLFQFYGQNYAELFVSTNGLITFGSANASGSNTDLENPPPQASIAPFWENLVTGAGADAVYWEVLGTGADERLVIQWNNVRLAGSLGLGQSPLNFQAVLRERDNSIQFNYQVVTGPILIKDLADKTVGTFVKGQQNQPSVASDAAGNYVVVWTANGQDGAGNGIYGRRYSVAGVPLGNEFQVNSIAAGDQTLAQIAMAADGRFVVVWQTDANEVLARLFDALGNPVGNPGNPAGNDFSINSTTNGTQADPAVFMDNTGEFVVAWRGNGTGDADGIYARRFDNVGIPLGRVDEIQRLQILGPPPAPGPDTFTLNFGGQITGPIAFAGVNNSTITALNIQTRLRADTTLSDTLLTVTAVQQNEVQTITFNPDPTGGTFTLTLGAAVTGTISFDAPNTTGPLRAAAIDFALEALLGANTVAVVDLSANSFQITFQGTAGNQNQLALAIGTNGLLPVGVTLSNVETVRGISRTELIFDVQFLGPDGGIDQPLLLHQNRLSGVTHLAITERVKGNSGEILANSFLTGLQSVPTIAGNPAGGFVINWTSALQDGSLSGVFAKRFDANGLALPGDLDEIQEIELVGPPAAGSTYDLNFNGQITAVINHTGRNLTDANAIQTALRNLANLGNTLTVRPAAGTSNEVQLVTFNGLTTGGTFLLAHAGLVTAPIAFAGLGAPNGVTTAANIQAALNALPNLVAGVTVVPATITIDRDRDFIVTFGGANGNIDQPLMLLFQNNLAPNGAGVALTEVNNGGQSTNRFVVEFNGVDGRTDHPNLLLNNNSGGVIAMNTQEIQKGANSEFIIPDTTLDDQAAPAIAWQPVNNGNFLSVWTSPDGDDTGVYARLFGSTGLPLGSEFQVNTFTQSTQSQPQAIVDAAGNFVIVWTSNLQDGSLNGIYARLFTSDGVALGDEFLVNQEMIANQSQPTIALTPTGFVIAWTSQAVAGGIHSRRFLANGTPLDVLELQVSQFGTPSQNQPVVARNAAGDYVVVWREDLRDPLVDQGIYFQKFFAGGGQTAEIRANFTTGGNQQLPDVAIDAAGNFVIVWQTFVDELTPLPDHFDVVARRFDANGVPLSGELALSTTVANNQTNARVALDGSGRFIATWQSLNQDGSNREILARRFDAANNPLDAQEFLVNTTTALSQSRPAIDALASGEFIIVWDSQDVNFGLDVFAQRFGANGQRIGTEFRVNTADVAGDFHRAADVAYDATGRFIVAWHDENNRISVRQFDANGLPLTGDVVVSSGTSQSGPRISTTPDGRSTVVWRVNDDIVAQRLTDDLQLVGANLTINAFTAGTQSQGTVSMGPNGEFLVGWLDFGQGGARVVINQLSTNNPSVGIKDVGTQAPFANLLPIWTNGANTQFVGSGLSTWIVKPQPERQRVFAVDAAAGLIRELHPDTGAIIRSIPAPGGAASGAGLAFVGNTLYYVSASGTSIFELDPRDGAIVDQLTLSSLGIVGQVGGLARLNGQLVAQVPSTGTLYFIDTFKDSQVRSLATGLPFFGGLAGGGARGSLFGLRTNGQIIEIDLATETVVNTFASPLAAPTGLAVVEGNLWVGDAAGAIRVLDADTGAVLNSFATAIPLSALGGDDNGGIKTSDTSIFQPLTGTILNDEATTPITAGVGPFTGRFIPVEPLDVFDGAPVTGLWTLEVQDTAPNHVGELVNWKLIINQPEQTPADFQTRAYLGDNIAQGANDIDLYRFNVLKAGSLTIDLAPFVTLDGVVRVFNASGAQLGQANAIGAGVAEHLVVNLPAGGTYYIGISSNANVAYNAVTGANATGGTTTGDYQLEVRFDQPVLLSDDNSTYTDATNFGQLGEGGHFAWTAVSGGSPFLNMPGAGDEPGHRDIPIEAHLGAGSGSGSIPTQFYNFQDFYGVLPSGDIPSNVITANQKQRAREIFEIYSSHLGIQFIETSDQGMTVVTGDPRTVDPTVPTGPGGVTGIAGGGRAVMDAAENWGSSEYGASWFRVAMHEIGHILGMGHSYDLPSLTIMGDQNSVDSTRFPDAGEPVFPGDADIVHGQFLFPPGANDTDLYRFELTAPGLVSAEVIAERQNGSSLLDANLTLYREYVTLQGDTKREVIAGNDDYFSSDPRIELRLAPGVYYVAVTSSGNKEFDPAIEDSGFGGRSEGTYELHLDFQGNPRSTLNDLTQKPLDGDADGKAGGKFDFWFQSGDTIFVDKLRDVTSGTDGNGSIAQPYDNIAAALNDAGKRLVIPSAGGAAFADGETFILVDNLDKVATFEFDLDGNTLSGNIPVLFAATDNQAAMASSIVAAINTATGLTATASVSGGKIVKLAGIVRLDMAGSETLRATPNIVRIVGNGGTDGNVNTLLDNRPYLVGFNNAGQPLVDGSTFRVPQASTVMIDAGALLKIQGAIIDVGSSAQGIDRREGALQVLGTPRESVYFRSFRDDTAGGNSDGVSDGVHPGDWGGLVLRNDSDREGDGLFLNWINHANMEAGGGKVTVGSVEETFTPIHMVSSRPGISYNTIRLSADAAISADPDSFDDSQGRIGPDIHDNLVTNNSINGLFVRIRTLLGNPVDRLNVPGRFDDTDIVHVLSENLFITGTPGGPLLDNVIGELLPRIDARLAIDPGIILKIDGARIETQIGGQLIAEGTAAHPIIFTTIKDDRYGASGSFDSSNDGSASLPDAGQWGGLFFGPFAKGSVDHALFTFAGGSTPIEGGFDLFSAMEIHQADVRLTNSTFQDNASGQSTGNRSGRDGNDGSVVFVRGAQPVIVNNIFKDNLGPAISINANAMQAIYRPDPGRTTGLAERFAQFDDNLGPLVRLNRLGNNTTNGMVVRGADLTTETAWDDTDIVHVLFNEIEVLNHHTFSGLRLLSGAGESLVVKMEGASAGLTADGVPLDIDDRIGGTLQVLGQPGYPVVLTSYRDCTVGAGYTPEGLPQLDTDNDGSCANVVTNSPYVDVIVVMDESGSMGFAQQFSIQFIADLEAGLLARGIGATPAGGNQYGLLGYGGAPPIETGHTFPVGAGGALFGTSVEYGIAAAGLVVSGAIEDGYLAMDLMFNSYTTRALATKFVILVTNEDRDIIDATQTFATTLTRLQAGGFKLQGILTVDIVDQNNNVALALDSFDNAYVDDLMGGYTVSPNGTFLPGFDTTIPDYADMAHATGGIVGDIDQISSSQQTAALFSQVLVDSIVGQIGSNGASPGDWRSVLLDTYANDRNVELVLESESTFIGPVDASGTPATAQFLGVLAPNEKSGDADRRLGFEVEGMIALDDPTDLDVYSFEGSTGSEVWIDIDRSSAGLDTIVELIDANGTVLAQSLDNATLSGLAQTMIKETHLGGDFYSINPRDAGMRVILPGQTGNTATYYVRVRSQPTLTQEANLEGGLSRGHYQLQVRLRQRDEVAGSTIQNSDIFYATNGIEIRGQNAHSPLVGETGEFGPTSPNDTLGTADPIGNLLQSDRNTISVAGNLSASNDLDWFTFTIDVDLIQAIAGFNGADKTWATMFDIDYADGISRPDTIISVFDDAGNLILVSRDSNIEDDQPGIGQGADTDDLTRGTFGTLDPYIGTVQMPAGVVPSGSTRRYYVAVSSNAQLPTVLNATFQSAAANPLIRLEPVNSVVRIAEDHIGFNGHTTGSAGGITSLIDPVVPSLIDISSSFALESHVLPLTLSDLTLYVSHGGGTPLLSAVNPGNGDLLYDVGPIGGGYGDIAMRTDGHLFGVQALGGVANTHGRLVELDWTNAAQTVVGNDGIPNFDPATNPPDPNQRTGDVVDAMAFLRTGFDGVNNTPNYLLVYSVWGSRLGGNQSVLYGINPATGVHTGVINIPPLPSRTRGLAFAGGQLFGVTDGGTFYRVGGGTSVNLGIQFAGLAPAPQNLQNGALANMMFAIDTSGNLYCLDTSGTLQPVFAGGATSVSTGQGGATGLAFSPLDFNLWHPTGTRGSNLGHGINPSFDESRNDNDQFPVDLNGRPSNEQEGGASMYFGLDNWSPDPDVAQVYFPYADNAQYGILTAEAHRDLASNPAIRGTYNLPGGGYGSLETSEFSLAGYSLGDKPTVYFSYFLNTEGRNSATDLMRDSFRVHISSDGGNTWEPLTTNNSAPASELPSFVSTSWNASDDPLQRNQETFDNTGGWRQARVDLSEFVGNSNLRFRFDFSTAGSMNQGVPGDEFGDYFNRDRTLRNNFEGVYIDDIIIGFAERGEMATASNGQTGYFPVPQNLDPTAPTQVLVGAYQLEIRRGTEYGASTSGVVSDITIGQQFDTNDRLIAPLLLLGDQNIHREQGHIVIDGNTIRQSSGFGIVVDAGTRDAVPHPGTVLNVTTLNNRRLAPGISLENNIIAELGTGGILFSGDPNTLGATAAVYYGRILNNTIYGGLGARGSGIVVTENANPTILNNIVVNTVNAITVDASSSATVVGTTLFLDNTNNGVIGSNAIQLPTGAPLFVNPLAANFYLANSTPASATTDFNIKDASNNSLVTVRFEVVRSAASGVAGNGVQLVFTKSDRGAGVPPGITVVRGTPVSTSVITIALNSNAINGTDAAELVALINGNVLASQLISAQVVSGIPTTQIARQAVAINYSPLVLQGGLDAKAIDSSLNTLAEDLALLAVKSPLGIPTAPIFAPDRDRYDQLRVDDPLQQPPPGLGSNVFKDRGAVERSDFVRPSAFIFNPLDNDAAGRDRNSALHVVNIKKDDLFVFALRLTDSGAGIDDAIVNAGQFVLRMNGRQLLQNIDYQFAYDANTNSVIFLPLAGIWTRNKTYTIDVDNSPTTGVLDRAGNRIEANQGDGTTRFTIFFGTVRDFGDAPDPTYPSLNDSNGASHEVVAGYHLGAGVDEENDAKQTSNADGDAMDDGLSSHSLVPGGTRSHIAVVASAEGKLDAWLDLNRDGDWDDAGEYIVSSATPAGQLVAGTNTINLRLPAGSRGASYLRLRFSSAGITAPLGVANDGEVEDYQVQLLGPLFQNPINSLDVTADGFVSPIDALRIINFINRYKDNPFFTGAPNFGNMPLPNPFTGLAGPDFLDTNGDGFVSPADSLLVLNFLNSPPPPTGEGEGEGDGMAPASFRSFAAGPVTTAGAMVVGDIGQQAVPAVMYANSSVVVEVKYPGSSQSQLDDQLFGSGRSLVGDNFQPVIDELHPSSQRGQKMEAKSRQRRENEDSWDDLLGDLASDIGNYRLEN